MAEYNKRLATGMDQGSYLMKEVKDIKIEKKTNKKYVYPTEMIDNEGNPMKSSIQMYSRGPEVTNKNNTLDKC